MSYQDLSASQRQELSEINALKDFTDKAGYDIYVDAVIKSWLPEDDKDRRIKNADTRLRFHNSPIAHGINPSSAPLQTEVASTFSSKFDSAFGKPADIRIDYALLHPEAKEPTYAHVDGDSGADLYSCEGGTIYPNGWAVVSTGVAMSIPVGYGGFIWGRSGLASRNGVETLGGVIDANYRDAVGVILLNNSQYEFEVQPGMRIAQIIFQRVLRASFNKVDSLNTTTRAGGFGTTGV